MEYRDLIKITRVDDHVEADVHIGSEDDFKAAAVSLVSVLNQNKSLGLMVLAGMLERLKNPGLFSEQEIIVPGGVPWDNDTQKRQENER